VSIKHIRREKKIYRTWVKKLEGKRPLGRPERGKY
jgi:hypothetical protein